MSDSYTKLFSSITASTIWQEPAGTRLTWITMLAMARKDGCVYASIPGLASQAKVTIPEVEEALRCFMSPDAYSRTKEHEGRRVEEIDGGWILLNHAKFAAIRTAEERREYWREYKRKKRLEDECPPDLSTMSTASTEVTPLALALTPDLKASPSAYATGEGKPKLSPKPAPCPYKQIEELYHEKLPELPRIVELTETRKSHIKARWQNQLKSLDRWSNYFDYVRESAWLMGQKDPASGRKRFVADIDYLINSANVIKIAEGKYHD